MKAILIQARMSSARFPGKVLSTFFNDISLVEFIYRRCLLAKSADLVAVVTSGHESDNVLFEHCTQRDIRVYRGSLHNVLERYVQASDYFKADILCRVCGDSPFIDVDLINKMFYIQDQNGFDYVYPDKKTCIPGFDSEIVTAATLKRIYQAGLSPDEKEHVTLYIKDNIGKFRAKVLSLDLKPSELSDMRLTVDEPQDLMLCCRIIEKLDDKYNFSSKKIIGLIKDEYKARISSENRD